MEYLLHGRLQFQELKKVNTLDSVGERNYFVNVGFGMKSVRRKITLQCLVLDIKYFFQSDHVCFDYKIGTTCNQI